MAKFCGKCGTRLDEATGLCPNCDICYQASSGKQYVHKKESIGRKIKWFILKLMLGLLMTVFLTIGIASVLTYFNLIDIPFISEIMTELGIERGKSRADVNRAESDEQSFEISPSIETTLPTQDPAEEAYIEVLAYCAELENKEEYVSILLCLDSRMDEDTRYTDLRSYYERKLMENVLETAKEKMESGQYKAAAVAIMDAQEVYTCSEFEELLEDCKKNLSVPLASCGKIEDSNPAGKNKDVSIGYWKDIFETIHADSTRFWVVDQSGWQNTEHIVYALNGNYTTLTGEIVSGSGSDVGSRATVLIYLDDELAYTSPEVTLTTQPVQFEIDVSGAERIRMVCTTDSFAFNYCIVDAVLFEI